MTRTASAGQIKELASLLLEGLPTDLPSWDAQRHIEDKGKLQDWLRLGLSLDLRDVDFEKIANDLEEKSRLLHLDFDKHARMLMERDGWHFVIIPRGLTLPKMSTGCICLSDSVRSYIGSGKIEKIPTYGQVVAWYPYDPLINLSDMPQGSNPPNRLKMVKKFSEQAREDYGAGVRAFFPTIEELTWIAWDTMERIGSSLPFKALSSHVRNRVEGIENYWAIFSKQDENLMVDIEVCTSLTEYTAGIYKLLVPA